MQRSQEAQAQQLNGQRGIHEGQGTLGTPQRMRDTFQRPTATVFDTQSATQVRFQAVCTPMPATQRQRALPVKCRSLQPGPTCSAVTQNKMEGRAARRTSSRPSPMCRDWLRHMQRCQEAQAQVLNGESGIHQGRGRLGSPQRMRAASPRRSRTTAANVRRALGVSRRCLGNDGHEATLNAP